MSHSFRPAKSFTDRKALFVGLAGGTNSGKSWSALRLARGIAGPRGKIAVLDTEGGRTLHLKDDFDFDAMLMGPPFRPQRFSEAAEAAEKAGYDALLMDSFTMEWRGVGGVLDWIEEELQRIAGDDPGKRERSIHQARIKPKMAHKRMVLSMLQRRIPIIYSIRGEDTIKPGENGEKVAKIFKPLCAPGFPFELTVSFRLSSERKGVIDLSDPKSWKMEGAHQAIFRHGELLSEAHGAKLAAWARGEAIDGAAQDRAREWADRFIARLASVHTQDALTELLSGDGVRANRDRLRAQRPELYAETERAIEGAAARLGPSLDAELGDDVFGEQEAA